MNNKNHRRLLIAYEALLNDNNFIDRSFENLGNSVGDLLFSLESFESNNPKALMKLQHLLDFYAKKADLILSNCKEDLTKKLLDLFSQLQINIDEIYNKKHNKIVPFSTKVKSISEGTESGTPNLELVPNKSEEYIISETIANVITLIREDRYDLIQPMFEQFKFCMILKDESNNMLYSNTSAAIAMKGNVTDFQGRNCYEAFPEFAEKYHADDLIAIEQNTPMRNIKEEVKCLNKKHLISVTADKIPIKTVDNKPLILSVFRVQ